jgi:hypothetical protein
MSITNRADYEVSSVILFLNAENFRPTEIHSQLVEVCGEDVMNKTNVHKWCRLFNGGRTDAHNEARFRRSSVITEDLKDRVDAQVREKMRFIIDELRAVFLYVSRTVLWDTVTVQLRYERKDGN